MQNHVIHDCLHCGKEQGAAQFTQSNHTGILLCCWFIIINLLGQVRCQERRMYRFQEEHDFIIQDKENVCLWEWLCWCLCVCVCVGLCVCVCVCVCVCGVCECVYMWVYVCVFVRVWLKSTSDTHTHIHTHTHANTHTHTQTNANAGTRTYLLMHAKVRN